MNKPTILDFLRHGEVAGGQYYRGITNDPLTEHGLQQMFSRCAGKEWDAVISSPLRRCRSFASTWCEQHQLTFEIDPNWQELNFGDWEGLTAEQITAKNPTALRDFYANPAGYTPPNAENYVCFIDRIREALENVLANHAGKRVLIVTHGGVIRSLFSLLLGMSAARTSHIDVPHACLTRFSCFEDETGSFIQLNYHNSD